MFVHEGVFDANTFVSPPLCVLYVRETGIEERRCIHVSRLLKTETLANIILVIFCQGKK